MQIPARNRYNGKFISRVAQLYYKKQLVIDNIRREDCLEANGTSVLASGCIDAWKILEHRYQNIPDFLMDRIQR